MARTYGYYRILSWCLALVPAGLGFFVLVAIVTIVLAVPWALLKPNPLKKLDSKISSKNTGCGRFIPLCSWSDTLKLQLKGILQLTERCSHFLFENDFKIQSSKMYGRILIISGRTFQLSFAVLSCLVFYNCVVLGIIFSVAMNYLVVHETSHCNENYDCFKGKDTAYSAQPLTNCSEIDNDNNSIIKCYYIDIRPAVALALVGGFLKIVPPLVFYATTTLYLILLKDFHWSIKVTINVILLLIFVSALAVISVVTDLRLTSYVYKNEERTAQVIVFLLLCICFTCWPWYVFEWAKVPEEEAKGADGDSESQEQINLQ